jgi:uncharacterized protein
MSDAPFPAGFYEGVRLFAAGAYFDAHEAFEDCLDDVEGDGRWDLLVALIQVAVGYHKIASGHPGGARMLGLGGDKLAAFPDVAWGVAIGALRRRVAADREGATAASVAARPPRIALLPHAGR